MHENSCKSEDRSHKKQKVANDDGVFVSLNIHSGGFFLLCCLEVFSDYKDQFQWFLAIAFAVWMYSVRSPRLTRNATNSQIK